MSQFFDELKRRKVFRVGIAYLVAAWVLLEVADLLSPMLGLPDWAPKLVFFLLAVGFIPALILAWAFEVTPGGIKRDQGALKVSGDSTGAGQKFEHVVVGVLAIALIGAGIFWFIGRDARWARDVAFPAIERHAAAAEWEEAYNIARQVEAVLPDDPKLDELWESFSWLTSIPSNPPGAIVYRRPYAEPDAEWEQLGVTPLYDTRIPQGLSLLRLELDGRPSLLRVIGGEKGGILKLAIQEKPAVAGNQIPPGAYDFGNKTSESVAWRAPVCLHL